MINSTKNIVITGGPGSGKSTLINILSSKGYMCFPEAGRAIIQDQVLIDGNALPWVDRKAFAELMLCWDMRSWNIAGDLGGIHFFDRGIPDIVGYLNLCCLPIPAHLEAAIWQFRYHNTVFIAPPWPEIYKQDNERKQTFEEAIQTYQTMVTCYQNYGYELIELPCVAIEERANFVINKLQQ
ncbi:AAA family ATPase [Providencia sneebia]|uniref:NadR/Ttd14 AAA domain-containing protein n=1 Tax=Providencia sneebia DSM 19967 TaxID=1141660 RepID=K8WFE3_9GAMM|nr:AAA family ATPase [Providencia sneebia]EKT56207.1 hypothetical protein OO7_09707 [Providencia sneebia DSM 19967]